MRVLVACEFSGIVREAFRARGHDAWSCALLPSEKPGPHIKGDVLAHFGDGWDLMIAFPPCTYLCRQGQRWIGHPNHPGRLSKQREAFRFVKQLYAAPIERVAIENPVGFLNSHWRRPDQIIQPWQFGHDYSKKTCLWLRGLPKLDHTKIVELTYVTTTNGKRFTRGWYEMPRKGTPRSRTFQGIADAMAEQWGALRTPEPPQGEAADPDPNAEGLREALETVGDYIRDIGHGKNCDVLTTYGEMGCSCGYRERVFEQIDAALRGEGTPKEVKHE